jgi:hypothetical protein
VEFVFRQPAAEAKDVGETIGRTGRGRMRIIEQRACPQRRAGAGVGQSPKVENFGVSGERRRCLAKGVAGVPRRATSFIILYPLIPRPIHAHLPLRRLLPLLRLRPRLCLHR